MQQSARDGELLPHAARQLAGKRPALVAELELVEQRPDPRLDVGHAVEPRDEPQMLLDREIVEQVRLVGDERERALGGDRVRLDVVPGDRDGAARRRDDAGEAAKRRRLAGAVRADEPEDLARRRRRSSTSRTAAKSP